jgi:hypothetical protein
METVRVAYRDDDRTPVICIREMGLKHYGVNVEVLKIKDYGEFEAALFSDSADVLIDPWSFFMRKRPREKRSLSFALLESCEDWTWWCQSTSRGE